MDRGCNEIPRPLATSRAYLFDCTFDPGTFTSADVTPADHPWERLPETHFEDWDVNDTIAAILRWCPRCCWLALSTDFYGPLFSVARYLRMSHATLHRLLGDADGGWGNCIDWDGCVKYPSTGTQRLPDYVVGGRGSLSVSWIYINVPGRDLPGNRAPGSCHRDVVRMPSLL